LNFLPLDESSALPLVPAGENLVGFPDDVFFFVLAGFFCQQQQQQQQRRRLRKESFDSVTMIVHIVDTREPRLGTHR
jgi:hypothetical protein